MSATAFPSGVRGMPVEATEAITPVVFWRKELRPDSGGPGRRRGGLGQVMDIGGDEDIPFDVLAMFERVDNAPKGRDGGHLGAPGRVSLASGKRLRSKGQQSIPAGDRLRLEMAGGRRIRRSARARTPNGWRKTWRTASCRRRMPGASTGWSWARPATWTRRLPVAFAGTELPGT